MAKLIATWRPAGIDLRNEADPVTLLARARAALAGIPELEPAVHLVDEVLDEIEAWAVEPIRPATAGADRGAGSLPFQSLDIAEGRG